MSGCRWAGSEQPRMLRTHVRDCEAAGCGGCQPCPERHCAICGHEHVTADGRGDDQVCAACIGEVRNDLRDIVNLTARLLPEAVHRGVNSEAASLAGPTQDTSETIEAYRWREMSAMWGRIPELDGDDQHPGWVLGSWEVVVRDHLSQPSEARITIPSARDYLDGHLTRLAHDPAWCFEELARDVRRCRGHLEDVLHDSRKGQQGAPCPMCGRAKLEWITANPQREPCACGPRPTLKHAEHGPCSCPFTARLVRTERNGKVEETLVRVYDFDGEEPSVGHAHPREDLACVACRREAEWDQRHAAHGDDPDADRWCCPRCAVAYTEHDYRAKVEAVYVQTSDRLTASQIAATYRVPEGTLRRWAAQGDVRRHGYDGQRRQLYDVGDTLAMRDAAGVGA